MIVWVSSSRKLEAHEKEGGLSLLSYFSQPSSRERSFCISPSPSSYPLPTSIYLPPASTRHRAASTALTIHVELPPSILPLLPSLSSLPSPPFLAMAIDIDEFALVILGSKDGSNKPDPKQRSKRVSPFTLKTSRLRGSWIR